MKNILSLFIVFGFCVNCFAQVDTVTLYKKTSVMIPMRDGVKLYTVIISPVTVNKPEPIPITRTPYGASFPGPDDEAVSITPTNFNNYLLAWGGYIFVYQDIRGKYKSEGTLQIHQSLIHATQKNSVDESSDTWDTVDWLTKNIANNN